ncbi:hypothetical protein BDN70DRAFT_870488 [Pholiota conissans]|uniref:Uncharacterized protein n=1 Tax=Pholiota conissans TaxID=109636 RepID=A0A9P5ZD36_9AGAR|nr:hypothetical protein BDN70DRAFT_870488 [Pholiota conissans]
MCTRTLTERRLSGSGLGGLPLRIDRHTSMSFTSRKGLLIDIVQAIIVAVLAALNLAFFH